MVPCGQGKREFYERHEWSAKLETRGVYAQVVAVCAFIVWDGVNVTTENVGNSKNEVKRDSVPSKP